MNEMRLSLHQETITPELYNSGVIVSAQDWIRTSTPFPAPPPQGGLSTNFNTWATGAQKYLIFLKLF